MGPGPVLTGGAEVRESVFEGVGGYTMRAASHQLAGELGEAFFADRILQASHAERDFDIDERKDVARFDEDLGLRCSGHAAVSEISMRVRRELRRYL